jgi:hypothetical protein
MMREFFRYVGIGALYQASDMVSKVKFSGKYVGGYLNVSECVLKAESPIQINGDIMKRVITPKTT